MLFYTIFDLLTYFAEKNNMTLTEMYAYFRQRHISKKQIDELKKGAYIPEELKESIFSFLEMNELEVNLALGKIPQNYQNSFLENISQIAQILKPDEENIQKTIAPFFENEYGTLYNDDCVKVLKSLSDNSVDMIFADPPFNLDKNYDPGIKDNLTTSNYLNWSFQWIDECVRILKPGGRIFIYNIPKWCVPIAGYLNKELTFWDWIAIDMKFNLPIQSRLYPAHYGLISFIKGAKANVFHNQRIPMQICRHCGGELKDYGAYKAKMNPAGVNVSDVWSDIYPVRHKNSKTRKYNELSVKLLDRIISMSTNPGDLILDPFGGSGTTYAVAQLLNRRWIGIELGDCETIKNRILNPDKDFKLLEKVYKEKNHLFTEETLQLRTKNGFWTCETVASDKKINSSISQSSYVPQVSFFSPK